VVLAEVRSLLRLARLLVRTARLVRAARRVGPAEIVHANDLETLPAGLVLARSWNARLVYDAHELYSEFERPVPRLARALTIAVEGMLARRADAVVAVSDALGKELVTRLRLRRQPLVVVNAPARVEIEPRAPDAGPLRAVYQGRLGPGRDLDDLLAAATAEGVELSLRIPLVAPEELRRTIAQRRVDGHVQVLEPIPPAEAVAALHEFDVGIVFDRPTTRNAELSLPNKLFEYLMAGLAVVAPRLETIGPLLEGEQVGLTYTPGDPLGLPATLERLARDRALLGELRERARNLALTRLNAEEASKSLVLAWEDRMDGD
jgi:glycosyltransferase involved in cell wall biosynthesis